MSFWGDPTCKPKGRQMAAFLETIRELVGERSKQQALQTCTSALHAITAYIVHRFGPREALAILEAVKAERITGEAP